MLSCFWGSLAPSSSRWHRSRFVVLEESLYFRLKQALARFERLVLLVWTEGYARKRGTLYVIGVAGHCRACIACNNWSGLGRQLASIPEPYLHMSEQPLDESPCTHSFIGHDVNVIRFKVAESFEMRPNISS